MTRYTVYDVFTDTPFGGNPLAVIDDASSIDEGELQRIAREFNFSETTFVFPPSDPAHTARVRIFTPTSELRFAGHPTVGTAVALHALGRGGEEMVLELGVGPISVRVADGHARFVTRVPLEQRPGPDVAQIAAAIGQDLEVVRIDRHAPVIAGLGTDFVIAELTGAEALESATPVIDRFRAFDDAAGVASLLIYIRDGQSIRARMFAPTHGIPEDPATGSAAAALAAMLGALDGRSQSFDITQGVEMGRPSLIEAEVTVDNGRPVAVAIGGRAVKVMEGRLTL